MKLEYNIVGVAKKSEEDLRTIYRSIGDGVFGLALGVTGSRKLAREIAVETFRRVVRYAVTFNTDMSGQYWILDICMQLSLNSLRDPAVSAMSITKEKIDNASSLLQDTLFKLGGDRGTMILLKALTDLKNVDIAQLCGYYSGSAGAEIRRGIAKLADMDDMRQKKELLPQLKQDIGSVCPDYYSRISEEEPTAVSHVSHEAMYLSEELNSFSTGAEEDEKITGRERERKEKAKWKWLRIAAVFAGALLIAGIVAGIIAATRKRNTDNEPSPPPGVQYGNKIDMVIAGGKLYYRGVGGGIFRFDDEKGEPEQIYDGTARELVTDGTKLYFRSDRSKLFSINTDGTGLKQLCDISGTTLCFSGGRLYFSASDGIYSMPGEGVADDSELTPVYIEEVEDAPSRQSIVVTDDGRVLFSGGADKGIFTVSEFSGSSVLGLIYFDEVYYLTLWNGKLLFDGIAADGIEMYLMDIDLKKAEVVGLEYSTGSDGNIDYTTGAGTPALSYSAAYTPYGDRLWYEGYEIDENGLKKNIGIYVISYNSGDPELLLPLPEEGLHVTEMLSDGKSLYCFYSDGRSDGERRLVAYDLNDFNDAKVVFDVRR